MTTTLLTSKKPAWQSRRVSSRLDVLNESLLDGPTPAQGGSLPGHFCWHPRSYSLCCILQSLHPTNSRCLNNTVSNKRTMTVALFGVTGSSNGTTHRRNFDPRAPDGCRRWRLQHLAKETAFVGPHLGTYWSRHTLGECRACRTLPTIWPTGRYI